MSGDMKPIPSMEEPLFRVNLRKGDQVAVYHGIPPDRDVAAAQEALYRRCSQLTMRRPADCRYNCHGMTLLGRHGHVGTIPLRRLYLAGSKPTECKDNTTQVIEDLLRNAGFKPMLSLADCRIDKLGTDGDVGRGDIVAYRDWRGEITHTATVWCCFLPRVVVLSKLGDGAEYYHEFDKLPKECPYGTFVEFWSDRGGNRNANRCSEPTVWSG